MALREMQKIDHTQVAIIQNHTKEYPIKLGDLARELGVSSIRISSLPTGISGQISREGEDYIIRVNRNEARERQRFTIAHELSHFLLHRDIIDRSPDGITDNVLYRSGEPERIEFEANRLAAEIVMPINLVKKKLEAEYRGIITEATIESLASSFSVSKAAMEIRLSTLSGE